MNDKDEKNRKLYSSLSVSERVKNNNADGTKTTISRVDG